jgi:hypothetical protein
MGAACWAEWIGGPRVRASLGCPAEIRIILPKIHALAKVRIGSETEIPCAPGMSGSVRIAVVELRSQACH